MLPDSSEVCLRLQNLVGNTIYVLADTAYERYLFLLYIIITKITLNYFSCCIDYIAAAHINADAIIHFGPVCFSQSIGTIPYLNIFDKHDLNIDKFHMDVQDLIACYEVVIVIDTIYLHKFGKEINIKMIPYLHMFLNTFRSNFTNIPRKS